MIDKNKDKNMVNTNTDKNKEAETLLNNLGHTLDQAKAQLNHAQESDAQANDVQQNHMQKASQEDHMVRGNDAEPAQHPIHLHSVYLKDMSFESPNTPAVFAEKWNPKVDLQINNKHRRVDNNSYELVLRLSISCKQEKHHAFFIELEQAGLFDVIGLDKQQTQRVLSTFCAEILFPYARATVDNLLLQGGFPPLKLAPINFVQAYEESLRQSATR